jgi:hypothetical protein
MSPSRLTDCGLLYGTCAMSRQVRQPGSQPVSVTVRGKMIRRRKLPEICARPPGSPQRQVHALLGAFHFKTRLPN